MSVESQTEHREIPLLTFNSLYNILREEKKSKTLQKLPELFYEALSKYVLDKKKEIQKLKSEGENDKLKRERNVLNNSQKMISELINLRCVKISNIAIKNELFGDSTLSSENVLEKEIVFLDKVKQATKKISKEID